MFNRPQKTVNIGYAEFDCEHRLLNKWLHCACTNTVF